MSINREFFVFSTAVTLKIRSRSPKSDQFLVMSQLYIHENLLRIQLLVHKILCRQESVTLIPKPMGSAPKLMPPSCRLGDIKIATLFKRSWSERV